MELKFSLSQEELYLLRALRGRRLLPVLANQLYVYESAIGGDAFCLHPYDPAGTMTNSNTLVSLTCKDLDLDHSGIDEDRRPALVSCLEVTEGVSHSGIPFDSERGAIGPCSSIEVPFMNSDFTVVKIEILRWRCSLDSKPVGTIPVGQPQVVQLLLDVGVIFTSSRNGRFAIAVEQPLGMFYTFGGHLDRFLQVPANHHNSEGYVLGEVI